MRRALVALLLLPTPAMALQTLVPSTTQQSIWYEPDAGVPLVNGQACIWVVLPGASNDPTRNRGWCGDWAASVGGLAAPANSVLLNPYSDSALDEPQPIPNCPDVGGQRLRFATGGPLYCPAPTPPQAAVFAPDSLPTGTTSPTYVMIGMASNGGFASVFTPRVTGNVMVTLYGGQLAGTSIPQVVSYELVCGTGTPPANGDPVPGGATVVGAPTTLTVPPAPYRGSINQVGYKTGLPLNTQAWCDMAIKAASGGFAQVYALNMYLKER